jgi:leader peptidase (prepilin peptidase) / N-methyltransferase
VTLLGLALVGVLGLAIGSFLNVVIYRVPRGESLVSPGSRCPSCGSAIRPWHNIPVLGWLMLLSAAPAYLSFAAVGLALALIDLDHRRLPNALVFPSYLVLALLLGASGWWHHDGWSFARTVIGGTALFAFFFAVVFYPAGMGFGDVKLSVVGGVLAYLSWSTLVIGAFLGFLLGAVVGVGLIALCRGGRKTAVPFGPFMIAVPVSQGKPNVREDVAGQTFSRVTPLLGEQR